MLTVIAAARSLIASGRCSLAGEEEGNGVKVNWLCLRRLDRVVTILALPGCLTWELNQLREH